MKISLNWLKRYIDIDSSPEKLSEILTDIGLEVEGMEKVYPVPGGLEGIVTGHVKEVTKHPNADKLSLTKVDVGNNEDLQIVCGAPNVAAGQKVLVATIGSTLYPVNGEPWKIKKGKIRGEVSEGMICAEDELGLGDNHEGIMVLDEDAPVGRAAAEYLDISEDYVYEIGLTPNRSDATSHLGVARDLAAYFRTHKNWTGNVRMPENSSFKVDVNKERFNVEIEDEEKCPRYSAVHLSNVRVGPSPQWMQDLLKAIGVRPINNVVDITNFVLHEYGQPLHAFDASKIEGRTVRIKTLPEGTIFRSLDEQERKLSSEDLMICDDTDTPMCMAGIFGGLESGVTSETTAILLESAHFEAGSTRRSSTRHLLRTEAAKVFEKGGDPEKTIPALKRAAVLFREHAGAEVSSEIIDEYPRKIESAEILVKYENVNKLIGIELDKEQIHDILRALKMELKPVDENGVLVKVPTDKSDVTREVDLIEEILRIYGFNNVPVPSKLKTTIVHRSYPGKRLIRDRISDFLVSHGFNEMMGLSLIESSYYSDERKDLVEINNTSNIHLDIMRPDAVVSGMRNVVHNLNHQQKDLRLFEFGRTYRAEGDSFVETEFLSLFLTGSRHDESWRSATKEKVDIFDMKRWVKSILQLVQAGEMELAETGNEYLLTPGFKVQAGNINYGTFGVVSENVQKKMGVDQEVYAAVLDYNILIEAAGKGMISAKEISRFPSVRRDLALVIDEVVKFEEILTIARKTDRKILREIGLFDIYRNEEHLGKGKKSYAIKFIFQDDTKTLKDKDVEKVMQKLIKSYRDKLNATIRT